MDEEKGYEDPTVLDLSGTRGRRSAQLENQDMNSNNSHSTNFSADDSTANVEESFSARASSSTSRRRLGHKPHNLEEKHQALNELFGFMPFADRVTSHQEIKQLYETPRRVKSDISRDYLFLNPGNIIWVLLFGWWISLIYIILSGLLFITFFGMPHARLCWQLKSYFFWPFGKYIVRQRQNIQVSATAAESNPILNKTNGHATPQVLSYETEKPRLSKALTTISLVLFCIIALPILIPCHLIIFALCWMTVVMIPMAKVAIESLKLLFKSPLELYVLDSYPGASAQLMLCTYEASNKHYFHFTVGGINVCLLNLTPFIVVTLLVGYVFPEHLKPSPITSFFTALVAIIPTAYFIGKAISSISAQSTFAVGAVLNATFGSVVELILYGSAIQKGGLDEFVQASLTGALLTTMLLLPGLSMIAGGLRYKEQSFNPAAAGVSNVLLIISVIGAFTPTIFYQAWGSYELHCTSCISQNAALNCTGCSYQQVDIEDDDAYKDGARPLIYAISFVLPLAYLVGLIFTLKTHAYIYEKTEEEKEAEEGEESPEWGKVKCLIILFVATASFALVSEELTASLQPALSDLNLTQTFVGVFFLALASNSAEIVNAVSFGLKNNIALSIEIGAAATVQAALIQIPALVLLTALLGDKSHVTFIFPSLNLFSVILGVVVNNYLSINGKSNYFEGSALVLIYTLFMTAFYFIPA